ncbi:hypothetical protein FQA47_007034 [Oryzias melastigma]|uniref:Uncharacterized protein n=1 Tax=Oryzias melastigma TaxID=30732 RepID=A0A834C8I1_ORYME|nr:hypothetical protein FQA47_007034 [Oryzias melastigma]
MILTNAVFNCLCQKFFTNKRAKRDFSKRSFLAMTSGVGHRLHLFICPTHCPTQPQATLMADGNRLDEVVKQTHEVQRPQGLDLIKLAWSRSRHMCCCCS